MTIRRAAARESQEILDLQKLAYMSEAQIYNDHSIPPLRQTRDEIETDFESHVFLVALEGQALLGSVRAHADGGTCRIGRLMVHPDLRNRGIGTRLMNEIEACFPEVRRFELFTGHESRRNIHLYQKLGYRIFRSEKITGRLTLVYMEKYNDTAGPKGVGQA